MDYRKFLINSDSPMEKIVYMHSGSFSVASGSSVEINVPHNLSFRPIIMGNWSNTPDFTITNEQGFNGFLDNSYQQLNIQSTATDIRFIPQNNTGSTVTFYYRVIGFMPPDVDVEVETTSSIADSFVINSEYNYNKLLVSQALTWSNGTQTIDHNLGYRPQVDVWNELELNDSILSRWYLGYDNSFTGFDSVLVTDTQIIFNFLSVGGVIGRKWYVRVYADSAVAL